MYGLIAVPAIVLAIGAVATWLRARRQGWRWGWKSGTQEVGDGAYRSAPVETRTPRRMPAVCAVASATSVAWGILTTFLFAPAGVLGCVLVDREGTQEVGNLLGTLLFGLFTLHGFALGARLMGLVDVLAVRRPGSRERIYQAAVVSIVHHVAVAISFALIIGRDQEALAAFAIPCAIGVVHAVLLFRAGRAVEALDREDADRLAA
jgi:hypothetical protein